MLGKDSAGAYMECHIDHWSKKREKTVKEKSDITNEYTQKYKNTAMQLLVNIYETHDTGKLTKLVKALHFINNFFQEFADEYFPNIRYPNSIMVKQQEYYPCICVMHQHDCHALLSDILGFAQRVQLELPTCKSVVKLNKYIQMAHTVTFFLDHVKKNNPTFWQGF